MALVALRLLFVAIILVLTGYLIWSFARTNQAPPENMSNFTAEQPDLYGEDIQFNQLNPDGSLHYRLHARNIRQFAKHQLTEMQFPTLHLVSPTHPPWDIDSQTGTIQTQTATTGASEDVVHLREDVRMVQNHPDNGILTIRSDAFLLYPNRQYAQTDQDVIIDTKVGRTTAASMIADLETGILKLSSSSAQRVHTIVLPGQFKKS